MKLLSHGLFGATLNGLKQALRSPQIRKERCPCSVLALKCGNVGPKMVTVCVRFAELNGKVVHPLFLFPQGLGRCTNNSKAG